MIDGGKSKEKEIHELFDDDRVINEWFNLTSELATFLCLDDRYRYTLEKIPVTIKEEHGAYVGYYYKANLGWVVQNKIA